MCLIQSGVVQIGLAARKRPALHSCVSHGILLAITRKGDDMFLRVAGVILSLLLCTCLRFTKVEQDKERDYNESVLS